MILPQETVSVNLPLSILHVSLPAFVSTSACSGLTGVIHLKNVSLFGMTSAFPARGKKKKNKSHPTWGGESERDVKVFVGAARLLRIRCRNVKQRVADSWGSLGRSRPLGGRGRLLQIQLRMRWFLLLPVAQTVFHYKSTVPRNVPPPRGDSARDPQARWSPAPGSCAAPAHTTPRNMDESKNQGLYFHVMLKKRIRSSCVTGCVIK